MRSRVYITALLMVAALTPPLKAEPRFTRAQWMSDIGLTMPLPDGFVANPLEMPRAEAYLVTEGGRNRLEDRFEVLDLWMAMMVRGRWRDNDGNELTIARLTAALPDEKVGTTATRSEFRRSLQPLAVKDEAARDSAVEALVPVDLLPPERVRRNGRRNFLELWRYPSTNEAVIVYAFRPRSPERREEPEWYMASFICAPGEEVAKVEECIDEDFLEELSLPAARARTGVVPVCDDKASETDLLAEDYRRNVVNYSNWHFVRSGDLMITDNLDGYSRLSFIGTLTNELPRLRREYASAVPPALADGFHPAAIRVFGSREEYLAYVGVEARWTGAIWSPIRRELVLYLSENGVEELLRTVWHEAFHQYLSYAGSMISSSPWLNEGHAELFENSHFDGNGRLVYDCEAERTSFVNINAVKLAQAIPGLLTMDYDDFYEGDQGARKIKYWLAWSIAYFLQVGAPEVRFRPFEKTRAEYLAELIRTRSAKAATQKVLAGEQLDDFIAEWLKFWRKE